MSFLGFTNFFDSDYECLFCHFLLLLRFCLVLQQPELSLCLFQILCGAFLSPWRSWISKGFSVSSKTTDILLRTQQKLHLQEKSLFFEIFSWNTSFLHAFECFLHYLLVIWVGKNVSLNSCRCLSSIYIFTARCYVVSKKHNNYIHAVAENIAFSSCLNIFLPKLVFCIGIDLLEVAY